MVAGFVFLDLDECLCLLGGEGASRSGMRAITGSSTETGLLKPSVLTPGISGMVCSDDILPLASEIVEWVWYVGFMPKCLFWPFLSMRKAHRLTVTAFIESIGKDYDNLEYCIDSAGWINWPK